MFRYGKRSRFRDPPERSIDRALQRSSHRLPGGTPFSEQETRLIQGLPSTPCVCVCVFVYFFCFLFLRFVHPQELRRYYTTVVRTDPRGTPRLLVKRVRMARRFRRTRRSCVASHAAYHSLVGAHKERAGRFLDSAHRVQHGPRGSGTAGVRTTGGAILFSAAHQNADHTRKILPLSPRRPSRGRAPEVSVPTICGIIIIIPAAYHRLTNTARPQTSKKQKKKTDATRGSSAATSPRRWEDRALRGRPTKRRRGCWALSATC